MASELAFNQEKPGPVGQAHRLSALVRRIVAPNPGPFTFTGTCSYIIGHGAVAVIDPGPDDPAHLEAVIGALAGESVHEIVVTHTHRDHSPGARLLQQATGARIVGAGPHRVSDPRRGPQSVLPDASVDTEHRPDLEMTDGMRIAGAGWTLQAVATPGHTANHLAFALPEEKALFSGDHVMAWSTSVVAPPDGSMRDYMASLIRVSQRDDDVFWPGHGGPVRDPQRFTRALIQHRRQREKAILDRLAAGEQRIPAIVGALYPHLDSRLLEAAALSVLAHLDDLVDRGEARRTGGAGGVCATFSLAAR